MYELFTPPRYFKKVTFHRHTDRAIGWLELFYDLVYVATLIQIGNFLSDNLTIDGFAQFAVLLTVTWWAWTGETFYQNRFVVDDLVHRLLIFTQIFAIASMGLSVSGAFGDLYVQFTLAYVVTRLMIVIMYIRAYRMHPESKEMSRGYITGFSLGIAIWLGSLLLPAEYHWVGWLIGIAVELMVPLTPSMRDIQRKWEVDVHHITERFGIFTIIVLGEAFVKILDDAQGAQIGIHQLLFSTFGLTILYALWWLYFGDTAGEEVDFDKPFAPVAWIYGHLPLALGLIAFGVGAKKLFASTLSYPADAINPDYRIIYTTALVLYLIALALIDYGLEEDDSTIQTQRHEAVIHLVGAGAIALIGIVATDVSPAMFVALISVVMVAQVIYNIYLTLRSSSLVAEQSPEISVD